MDPKFQTPTNSSDDPLVPNSAEEAQPAPQVLDTNDLSNTSDLSSAVEPVVNEPSQDMPVPGQSFSPTAPANEPEAPFAPPTPVPAAGQSPAQPVGPAVVPSQTGVAPSIVEETPDLPPQPPALNKRIFTPPPEELLKKPSHKRRNILIAVFVLLVLGGVGAYFGYYVPNKPENMWKSALVNTGKGYDQLIKYTDTAKEVQGWSQQGKFDINGVVEVDGNIQGESSGDASVTTGAISAMGTKVNFDVRTLPSNTATPDMYFKVDGLDGLGSLVGQGDPQVEAALNGLNNQWYVIDHTLFEQFEGAGTDPAQTVTAEDATALFKAFGVTSKEFVFTDDTEKAVVVVKDEVGKEKKNGRSVYHYKIDTNDKQAEKYVIELCKDLQSSKIGKVLTSSMGEESLDCDTAEKQPIGDVMLKEADLLGMSGPTDEPKSSGELVVDAWVDTKTKLIQSLRFSNSDNKKSYVEVSQNFTGGDKMPFKFEFQDGPEVPTKLVLEATFDTKTQAVDTKGEFTMVDQSNDENNVNATFSYAMKPTKEQPKVERPEGAKNIIELMNALGVGDLFAGGGSLFGGAQARAEDTDHMNNLKNLQMQLEVYYNDNDHYPTLAQANQKQWVDSSLAEAASATNYGYAPKSESGGSCVGSACQTYALTAILSSGETYSLNSIN